LPDKVPSEDEAGERVEIFGFNSLQKSLRNASGGGDFLKRVLGPNPFPP
jgi:hypothetical protein